MYVKLAVTLSGELKLTLGFAIYYAWECLNKPVSIIFPFTSGYSRETTQGFSRIWKYTIELP